MSTEKQLWPFDKPRLAPMRSEFDDEERVVPMVPQADPGKNALIAFVNGLPWKKAWLPEQYSALDKAVAEIQNLDLLKGLADKTAALASYARALDKNEVAARNLTRANNAIWRRMGALYKECEGQAGRPPNNRPRPGPISGAAAKGREIGHSKRQVAKAKAIASVPPAQFDKAQKSEPPPSATALEKAAPKVKPALKKASAPRPKAKEQTPEWKAATKLLNAWAALIKATDGLNIKLAVAGLEPDEKKMVRADLQKVKKQIDKTLAAL